MSVLGDTRQRASIRCARSLQTAGRSDAGHHRARPLRQAGFRRVEVGRAESPQQHRPHHTSRLSS